MTRGKPGSMTRVGMPRPVRREARPMPGAGVLVYGPALGLVLWLAAYWIVTELQALLPLIAGAGR